MRIVLACSALLLTSSMFLAGAPWAIAGGSNPPAEEPTAPAVLPVAEAPPAAAPERDQGDRPPEHERHQGDRLAERERATLEDSAADALERAKAAPLDAPEALPHLVEAAEHFLAALETSPGEAKTVALLEALGDTLDIIHTLHASAPARELAERLAPHLAGLELPVAEARLALFQGFAMLDAGALDDAVGRCAAALDRLPEATAEERSGLLVSARSQQCLGRAWHALGRLDSSRRALETSQALHQQFGLHRDAAFAAELLASIASAEKDPLAAVAHLETAVTQYERAGRGDQRPRLLGAIGMNLMALGRLDDARERFEAALVDSMRREDTAGVRRAHVSLGKVAFADRRFAHAARHYEEAADLALAQNDIEAVAVQSFWASVAAASMGDGERTCRALTQSQAAFDVLGNARRSNQLAEQIEKLGCG